MKFSKLLIVGIMIVFGLTMSNAQERRVIEANLGEVYVFELNATTPDIDFVYTLDTTVTYQAFMVDSYNSRFQAAEMTANVATAGRALWFQLRNGTDFASCYRDRRAYRERERDTASNTWGGVTPERSGPVAEFKPENARSIVYVALYKNEAAYYGTFAVMVKRK